MLEEIAQSAAGQNLDLKRGYKLSKVSPAEAVQNWLSLPFTLDGTGLTQLPALVKDPDFSVESATAVVRDGKTLVQINFTTKPKKAEDGAWIPVRGGRIVFDPERYWVMRESDIQLQRSPNEKEAPESVVGTYESVLCAISSHSNAENRRENEGSEQ